MNNFLSLHRLAARLRIPRDWLRQEALSGRLPHLRIGSKLFFNPIAIEQVLADRAAKGEAVADAH